MGWLEGILSGYSNRMGEIRRDNAAAAEQSAQREGKVYEALLNSGDPEIRGMAATGLLQSTQPRRSKSGLSGWMGEMEGNPIYPTLMKYMQTPKPIGEDVKTTVTTPQQAGYLPTLPDTSKPAAQTTTQTTTPGAPPPVATQATPNAGPPPPPAGIAGMAPPSQVATPPPAISQLGPDQIRGALPPSAAAPDSLRQTTRTPIIGLPHAFPTTEEAEIAKARAGGEGEYQSWVDIGRRAGQPNPEQWAADQYVQEKIRRSGGLSPRSVAGQTTAADGTIHQAFRIFDPGVQQYIDPVTRQPDPHFTPITGVGMGQFFERAAVQSGYGRGSMVPDWAVAQVQSLAEEMAQGEAGARTTGTREARTQMLPSEALAAAERALPNGTTEQKLAFADSLIQATGKPPAAAPAAATTPPAAAPTAPPAPTAVAAPTGAPGALSGPAAAPAPPPGVVPSTPAAVSSAAPAAAGGPAAPTGALAAKKVNGKWVISVPTAGSAPAAAPAPAAAAVAAPAAITPTSAPAAAPPPPPGGATFGSRVLGALPPGSGDQSKLTGKPLSPELEKLRAQTQATNDLIDSALTALTPFKNDNSPEGTFNLVKNYRQGVYDPINAVAAQLSDLAGLQAKNSQALSAGGTRAWQYVVQKSEHVPKLPSTSEAEKYSYLEQVPLLNDNRAARILGTLSRLGSGEGHMGGYDTPQLMYHKLEQVKLNNQNFLEELQRVTVPSPGVRGVGQPPPQR